MRKKDLPSFSSLIAFESAARQQSFKRAAEDICVSQAAISRQIRLLEENLGCELFARNHKTVSLNDKGKLFLDAVSLGLSHIEIATNQLRESNNSTSLTIGLMSSFAGLFLAPRIGEFRKLYPDIDIYVISLERNPDPKKDHFDIMITMGETPSALYKNIHLFEEEIFPVCSPYYLNKNSRIDSPLDLLEHSLLSTDDEHWENIPWAPINWDSWFTQLALQASPLKGLRYSNYQMMINTVISGHGICLGWKHLVDQLITEGSLIKPIKEKIYPGRSHYLLIRKIIASRKDIVTFESWFLDQIQTISHND